MALLDIHGECRAVNGDELTFSGAAEALQSAENSSFSLVTDWGPGGVVGVSTVIGQASTAAAVLEKKLRDQGDTDDISHILVHQSQARSGSTELVFTAVPIKTWRRYQQLSAAHSELVLVHDWVKSLLTWAKAHDLVSGKFVVLHAKGLDVLVLEQGRVRVLDRLPAFGEGADAWQRLGQRVVSAVEEVNGSDISATSIHKYPTVLLVFRGAESCLPAFIQGLAPTIASEVWAEDTEKTRASLGDSPVLVQSLDWGAFTASLPLRQAVNSPLDKAAAWAEQWVPLIGVAAFCLACIMALTAAVMHYNTQVGMASISGDVQKTQNLWQVLNTDVQQAEKITAQQKEIREWVQQRVNSNKVPDMSVVLAHVRSALPPGMVIDEVGIVVEKDSHLVTVIGHASLTEDSLRSESAFAQALQSDGFTLKKRDVLQRDGQPKFKLSMTWSAI
jgi:hypothetical protein